MTDEERRYGLRISMMFHTLQREPALGLSAETVAEIARSMAAWINDQVISDVKANLSGAEQKKVLSEEKANVEAMFSRMLAAGDAVVCTPPEKTVQ